MSSTKTRYDEVRAEGGLLGERKDCAVVAVALACRTTYEKAHQALANRGRKSGQGTWFFNNTVPACKDLGFKLTRIKRDRQKGGSRYTPRTVGTRFKKGYYLCRMSGHIFAVVNGQVLDHMAGRCPRIKEIYRVTKTRMKEAASV